MSNMSAFLKKNKAVKANVKYAATKSLCGDDGKPLEWEIKPLSTKEDERIREACTTEVPIPGKPNMYRNKMNTNKYIAKLISSSVVFPDLYDVELQDSYEAKTPEDLVKEMVDDSGEWNAFVMFINEYNGFVSLQEDIDEAKN